MKRRGLTLIEILIAVTVFMVLASTIYLMMASTSDAYASGSIQAGLNAQARDLLERLTLELSDAGIGTLNPSIPTGATALTFQRNVGYAGGVIAYGPAVTYAFVTETGEYPNGTDDNGDGRIDEGRLVRTENNEAVTLSRDLAAGGIAFTRVGNAMQIVLVLEKVDDRRQVVRTTSTTAIQVRN